MALTPDELSGHALGLHTSGMLTMQGVGAALAGGIAQLTSVPTAIAMTAGLSLAVTAALARGLRAGRDEALPEPGLAGLDRELTPDATSGRPLAGVDE